MGRKVWLGILCAVVLGAVLVLPPALMLLFRTAKLDLRAEGVVVVPSLSGAFFSLSSALILAALMLVGADTLRWVQGRPVRRRSATAWRSALGLLGGVLLYMLLSLTAESSPPAHTLMRGLTQASPVLDKLCYALALIVIIPAAEEIFFRGALEETLGAVCGSVLAIPLTATAFALAHGTRAPSSFAFAASVLFSLLVQKNRSLMPAVFAHATFNALVLWSVLTASG